MPIISSFPGGGSTGGGISLAPVTDIKVLVSSEKVYVKWTDPSDIEAEGSVLAGWGGTILVRKAGSSPANRRDGTVVVDSVERDEYQDTYFCDSGLSNNTIYYYKFFPYTTSGVYTDDERDEFNATPTVQVEGIDDWNVTDIVVTPSGNGKLDLTWTDPALTIESDGIVLATWGATTVVVKEEDYPTSKDDEDAAYSLKVVTRNQYSSSALTVEGLTNGTTYYIQFYPETTDGGVNTNTVNRATGVADRIVIADVPTQSGSLTYNGNTQSPTWDNYDPDQITISGDTIGVSAGTYTATFTPLDDYQWSDGSITEKSVTWTIDKATPNLSLSPTSLDLDMNNLSGTITVTYDGDGTLSIESSDPDVVTATLSGTTITVIAVDSGSVTITASASEGSNYLSPDPATCVVTATLATTVLDENSWDTISKISASSQGANYWQIGDTKKIHVEGTVGTLSVDQDFYVFILGFDHNSSLEGTGITFGCFKTADDSMTNVCLVNSYNSTNSSGSLAYFTMNHWGSSSSSPYNTNYGGWRGCDLRYDILGSTDTAPSGYGSTATTSRTGYDASDTCATDPVKNTLMAALPEDLRAVMKPMTVYTDGVGNSSNSSGNVVATIDYLPLLAEFEVQGTRSYANQYEQNSQAQYSYYAIGNSKIKYQHSSTGSTAYWWCRSAYYSSAYCFCYVSTSGSANSNNSRYSYGAAPCFRI